MSLGAAAGCALGAAAVRWRRCCCGRKSLFAIWGLCWRNSRELPKLYSARDAYLQTRHASILYFGVAHTHLHSKLGFFRGLDWSGAELGWDCVMLLVSSHTALRNLKPFFDCLRVLGITPYPSHHAALLCNHSLLAKFRSAMINKMCAASKNFMLLFGNQDRLKHVRFCHESQLAASANEVSYGGWGR